MTNKRTCVVPHMFVRHPAIHRLMTHNLFVIQMFVIVRHVRQKCSSRRSDGAEGHRSLALDGVEDQVGLRRGLADRGLDRLLGWRYRGPSDGGFVQWSSAPVLGQ